MLRNVQYHAPIGRYVCLFDGDGVVSFSFDATVLAQSKGRVEFYFRPTWKVGCTDAYCGDNGLLLQLLATNPSNPVHNVSTVIQYHAVNTVFVNLLYNFRRFES